MKKIVMFLSSCLLLCATLVFANPANYESCQVSVKDPEVKVKTLDAKRAVVSMELDNHSNHALTLVAANTSASVETQLHHTINGKMIQVKNINIPAKGEEKLQGKGFHVMLVGITSTLKINETLPVTLIFSDGSSLVVKAVVEKQINPTIKTAAKKA